MKLRHLLSVLFVIVSLNLFAQAEIVSITYDGDVAILTTNVPPDGIVYYWQGTSCGTLMNHSSSTTLATTDGTYYLREFNSTGAVWSTSCASTFVLFPDLTPPVLSGVTTGPIEDGDPVAATSNENGMIYLVPDGTAASISAISAAKVAEAAATENVEVSLATDGIGLGDFIVYAVDGSDNISLASPVIEVADLTAPVLSDVTAGPIEAGTNILATSDEDGMVYLVPDGTAANLGDITSGQVAQIAAVAAVPSTLVTTGIAEGDYIVYAIDGSDNISAASPVITVTWASSVDPNDADLDQVQLYPSNVTDILYIKSKVEVSSAMVYSLQGAQVINITTSTDQIDMSGLAVGVYIVKVTLVDNTIYSGKVNKK